MKQYVDTDIKTWRPLMIRLTQIASGDFNNNEPTVCFIDPICIVSLQRGAGAFTKRTDGKEKWPDVDCTLVVTPYSYLHVLETPAEISLLREKALGNIGDLKSI
jgi:hypothetical protein